MLSQISLSLSEGDRIAVLGANGAGKTTLLRLLCGILTPTAGTLSLHGSVGSVIDAGFGFDYGLSGASNAYSQAIIQGATRRQAREFVGEVRDFADIGEAFERAIKTYSQGMISRLAIACAVAQPRDILILDEALAAGDVSFQEKVLQRTTELLHSASIVVTASHSVDFVRSWFTRGIVLDSGGISFDGALETAVKHYLDPT